MKLNELTIKQASEKLAKGEINSVELTKACLGRIKEVDGKVKACLTVCEKEALLDAEEADRRLKKGERGDLLGIPCLIKDNILTRNIKTTAASKILENYIAPYDATIVKKFKAAGVVILGKTNLDEFAHGSSTENSAFGPTHNPWDLERTPGGSTGGGAAALAAGLSYLSIGSDIGGSIRTPSNFCGVFGHKPSLNVISGRGHIPPLPGTLSPPASLSVIGPLARSAADLKLALKIFGGPDPNDAIAYSWNLPPSRGSRLSDYRIGYVFDDPLCPVISEVKELLIQAVNALRERGAELEEGWPSGVNPSSQYETYRFLLMSTYAYALQDDQVEETRQIAAKKDGSDEARTAWAFTAPHKHFQAANVARMTARAVWQDYFRTHDVFLLPTTFVPAFPHDHSIPMEKRRLNTPEGPRAYLDILFWISFATLTGLPATTAPIGLTKDGLPVGIQIIGPYLEDATPIDFAGILADITGGFKPPKGYNT